MFIPLRITKILKYLDYLRRGLYRFQNVPRRNSFVSSNVRIKVVDTVSEKSKRTIFVKKSLDKGEILLTVNDKGRSVVRIVWDTLLALFRVILIVSTASVLLVLYCVNSKAYANGLIRAMEFLGPTFVKLGQWASTRRDMFSEDICDTLTHLQRYASVHSWMYTQYLLSVTYGPRWSDLFVHVDKKPIGSGCCAQVYRAWISGEKWKLSVDQSCRLPFHVYALEFLHVGHAVDYLSWIFSRTGTSDFTRDKSLYPVVIKVLHPGVEHCVETDLFMIELIAACLSHMVPSLGWLNLTGCINEFSMMMRNQLNMRLEAENLQIFARNFANNKSVIFPYPLMNLTTREIIVETYHEGKPISDYFNSPNLVLKSHLAKICIALVSKMIFVDNFVHCDLHPGNILVQEENKRQQRNKIPLGSILPFRFSSGPRLVILDCGLVASLNDRCLQNLLDVFRAISIGDGAMAGEYIMRHSSHMTPDPSGFKNTMESIIKRHIKSRFNLENVNLTVLVREFYSAIIHYQVQQDSAFINVILSMLVIEGLGRNLDPTNDILQELISFLGCSTKIK